VTVGGRTTVTVIIPCFNQARFLAAAIRSACNQREHSVECIVVDDGSTDGTSEVAGELGVRVIRQPNRGLSEARNAGLAAARGEFVVFLDADDELLPGALARSVETLASNVSAAAVVGRCQAMDSAGVPFPVAYEDIDASNLYEQWLSRNFVWTPGAVMFRRAALEEIHGFPKGLGPAADYAVYLRLARMGRVVLSRDEVARYRRHDSNMSRDLVLMLRTTLAVLRRERREAPAWARAGIRRGRKMWCRWYGEGIVAGLRRDWHARQLGGSQLRAALALALYCPSVLLRHVARKARVVLSNAVLTATPRSRSRM
jgi:glycosyltransferase involved in cell wall biosynthesis